MDKLEQLFIRACKSNTPKVRLVSVLRRFYLVVDGKTLNKDNIASLINHLGSIVDAYVPMKSLDIVSALEENNHPFYNDTRDFRMKALDMMIVRIRQTKKSGFVGLSAPRRFK